MFQDLAGPPPGLSDAHIARQILATHPLQICARIRRFADSQIRRLYTLLYIDELFPFPSPHMSSWRRRSCTCACMLWTSIDTRSEVCKSGRDFDARKNPRRHFISTPFRRSLWNTLLKFSLSRNKCTAEGNHARMHAYINCMHTYIHRQLYIHMPEGIILRLGNFAWVAKLFTGGERGAGSWGWNWMT